MHERFLDRNIDILGTPAQNMLSIPMCIVNWYSMVVRHCMHGEDASVPRNIRFGSGCATIQAFVHSNPFIGHWYILIDLCTKALLHIQKIDCTHKINYREFARQPDSAHTYDHRFIYSNIFIGRWDTMYFVHIMYSIYMQQCILCGA